MPLLHRLDRKLNLTASQHSAVFAILKREREAMVASGVFAQGREAVRAAMEARREKVGDEIAGLLTAEQKTTFDALRSRMRERMAGGFGRGEMLTRELGLSAAQQEQLKGMLEARRGTFHEVRQALRAGTLNRAELRQKARAGREAFRTELEGILTPEQRTHFRQMVEEWKKDFQK
jgi:Spy/CpxP family protein refolding chaperone